jgi:hypothetical protein
MTLASGLALADRKSDCESAECDTLVVVPEWNSAFADYKRFETQPIKSWQQLNDRVGEIGGWRTYAMEAYEEEDSGETQPDHESMMPSGGQKSGGGQ